jgi:hypothetical protein
MPLLAVLLPFFATLNLRSYRRLDALNGARIKQANILREKDGSTTLGL